MNYIQIYSNKDEFFNKTKILWRGFLNKKQTEKIIDFTYKYHLEISIATINHNEQEDKNLNIKTIINELKKNLKLL